jgi:anti-sigma-K factor RskA
MSDELERLAGAYALDAVSDDEREAFERLLAERPDLRDEVDGFRATAAQLGAGDRAMPPADLKARVMAQVAATPQERPVVSLSSRRRWSVWVGSGLAAAAVVLIAVLGVVAFRQSDRASEAERLADVLSDPAAVVVDLDGLGENLRLVYSPREQGTAVLGAGVPLLAAGRTYEVWLVQGDGVQAAGLFHPDEDGGVRLVLASGVPFEGDAVAVTDEPEGGAEQPSTPVLAEGEIT